jgi:hypothetical protein
MIWFIYAFLWVVFGLLAAIAFGRMCGSPIDHVQATVEKLSAGRMVPDVHDIAPVSCGECFFRTGGP